MEERKMKNKTRSRRMLAVLPIAFIMLFSAIPALSMNAAAATASVSVSASYVFDGQQISVYASFSGIYTRTPDYGNPNAMLEDTPNTGLRYWYYPTTSGSYSGTHTPTGLGLHTVYMWYATGWDRIWGEYKYASKSTTFVVLSQSGDYDVDTMPNNWEVQYGLNPLSNADKTTDLDGDGLLNYEEYAAGANPTLADTDGDSFGDHTEAHIWGSNPNGQARWAIIICGARDDQEGLTEHYTTCDHVFTMLTGRGLTADHIEYLAPSTGHSNVDLTSSRANVQWVVNTWLDSADEDDRISMFLVDHGATDLFVLPGDPDLTAADMASWIDTQMNHMNNQILNFIIESCNSGSWQDNIMQNNPTKKIFMSACLAAESSWYHVGGESWFTQYLCNNLQLVYSYEGAFGQACVSVQAECVEHGVTQTPLIQDGDVGQIRFP
jgi:hypothetical protein